MLKQLNVIEDELNKFKEKYLKLEKEFMVYKRNSECKYDRDVMLVKLQNENNSFKVESFMQLQKHNEMLYKQVLELENVIKCYKYEEQLRMKDKDMKYQQQIATLKQKMINYLKNEYSVNNENNTRHKDLNIKLNQLHINELIKDLEFQEMLIEDLINENNSLKQKVRALSNDVVIHKEVEKCLEEKNRKFKKQLLLYNSKLSGDTVSPLLSSTKSLFLNNNNNKGCVYTYANTNNVSPLKTISNLSSSRSLNVMNSHYKVKYESIKEELNDIYNKYRNIFNIYNTALNNIKSNNAYSKEVKEFFKCIHCNKRYCEYNELDKGVQEEILITLMKEILPLVKYDEGLEKKSNLNSNSNKKKRIRVVNSVDWSCKLKEGKTISSSRNLKNGMGMTLTMQSSNDKLDIDNGDGRGKGEWGLEGNNRTMGRSNTENKDLIEFRNKMQKKKLIMKDKKLMLQTFSLLK